ncbi:MAG: alpha/beta hydrolase [Gordonia paraffinivorans]
MRIDHRRRVVVLAVAAVVVVAAIVTGVVVRHDDGRAPEPSQYPFARIGGGTPGSLLSAEPMSDFTRSLVGSSMRSARVTYRSSSGDTGAATVVSGAVFTPRTPAPVGGWPVIAFAHGTTGIDTACAPSLSPTLSEQVGAVDAFVRLGFAVAMPDYQGLGSSGVHPYLDSRTAGIDTIDAVRALRATFPDISNRWAAYGGSQGGGATWAAATVASQRAPELSLVGAVAIAPAADVAGLVDKAVATTLTADQRPAFQAVVESLARLHPDIDRDDYRRGAAAAGWGALTACSGPLLDQREAVVRSLRAGDLAPSTPVAADRVRSRLRGWALPQGPLVAPLYVEHGGRDTFIDASWTRSAVERQCVDGGSVTYRMDPDRGHGDIPTDAALRWLGERFGDDAPTNSCSGLVNSR